DNPALAFNPGTLSGTYGNLTLDAAGNWSYSLDGRADGLKQGEQAQDNLTVTLNDGSTTTVSIAITGTNNAPQLQAHSQTVDEDHSASGNLLGNATDVDHDTLSLVDFSVDGVTHAAGSVAVIAGVGSLSVAADGQYSFTPQANWSGTLPTVTYSVSDGTTTAQSSLTIQVTPVADAPLLDLNNPPSHPVATGLTLQTWTGLALGTGGSGAAPATLQSTIDHAGVPAGSGQLSNLANGNVSAGTASKISGLIHLEAGHTYSFSGVGDDSIRLVIGGTVVGQATWGANSGAFSGTFTPTTSGYYTLDLYHHNQNGPGNYDVNFQVDGGALRDLSTANAELFRSTVDLAQEGIRLSALQGTGGQGYYREYAQNEGDEDTAIPLSGVHAALTDTDGSESLHLSIGDIPVGARLSDGSHSFTASAGNT
ncbi:VCBS domain-containing protein, partial [Pseudomonas sp. RIT-PI-AD]|uniref:VCBS domain-containing protein n=1 Tax=Pseudomonas sp. RIT-PI-AD TaxID=3035294 RepID=UPI0021DA9D54